ncbi:MAG: hypothetical protein QOD39_1422 [Mycobacterium sp.]|jgi:hypothetical protein|nr:hypothetical protein [Mycobacterium sp.]
MVLAAKDDVDAANVAAQQAMTEHDRIPMPFERARTQLLLGQLQHRGRQKDAASVVLQEALSAFDRFGIPLWQSGRAPNWAEWTSDRAGEPS